jgi:leucine dehydrogenase
VRGVAVERVHDELGAIAVRPESVLTEDVDVFAPCALGAILNSQTIPLLRARIVAGAANNQLAQERHGFALQAAGVTYAPDYVINAGGIISVAHEYLGNATDAQVIAEIHGIPARLTEIFERARRERQPSSSIADAMARERIGRRETRLVA